MKLIDIDKKIPDLNNLSLREVFEVNNLALNPNFDENTNWTTPNASGQILNNEIIVTPTNATFAVRIEQTIDNAIVGNTYYLTADIFPKYATLTFFQYGLVSIFTPNPTPNQWNTLTAIVTATATTRFRFYHSAETGYVLGVDTWKADNIKIINLTSLGLTTLTKEQLDHYFALYQSGVEASGFVQKTSKNLFDKSRDVIDGQRLNLSGGIVFSTNAKMTDIININVGQTYTISGFNLINNQAISVHNFDINNNWVSLQFNTTNNSPQTFTATHSKIKISMFDGSPSTPIGYIDTLQLELGTVATAYQPYRPFALGQDGTVQAQAFIQTAGKDTRVPSLKSPFVTKLPVSNTSLNFNVPA